MKCNGSTVVLLPMTMIAVVMGIHVIRSNIKWTKMVYSLTTLSFMAFFLKSFVERQIALDPRYTNALCDEA